MAEERGDVGPYLPAASELVRGVLRVSARV